eukprot:991547-Rhodomonas_salina.1
MAGFNRFTELLLTFSAPNNLAGMVHFVPGIYRVGIPRNSYQLLVTDSLISPSVRPSSVINGILPTHRCEAQNH